jgi:putative transposase
MSRQPRRGVRVVRVLDELAEIHGRPQALRMDNGPELIAEVLMEWCREHDVKPLHIQPGKPDQNAFVERFNRSFREDVLGAYTFASVEEVRAVSEGWLADYNHERPHDSLGGLPPCVFMPRPQPAGESSYELSR